MRTNIRRLVVVILFVVFAVYLVPTNDAFAATIASGSCGASGSTLTWKLNDSGKLTISGTGKMADYSATYSTDGIHSSAPWFQYRDSIQEIVLSDGVTSIGSYAFVKCNSLIRIIEIVFIP